MDTIGSDSCAMCETLRDYVHSLGPKVLIPIAWKMLEDDRYDSMSINRACSILCGDYQLHLGNQRGRIVERLEHLLGSPESNTTARVRFQMLDLQSQQSQAPTHVEPPGHSQPPKHRADFTPTSISGSR